MTITGHNAAANAAVGPQAPSRGARRRCDAGQRANYDMRRV